MIKKIHVIILLLLFPSIGRAYTSTCPAPCTLSGTTWTCADISRDCVQDAVIASEANWNVANKIVLASGSASWTGTGGVECTAGTGYPMCIRKGITIEGAGVDSTVIKVTTTAAPGIRFQPDSTARSGNHAFVFSSMTIDGNWTYRDSGNLSLTNNTNSLMTKARIHRVKFINSGFNATTFQTTGVFGVVDNCVFQDSQIWQRTFDSSSIGWERNLQTFGTENDMYYEDNTITATVETLRVAAPGPSTQWTIGDTISGVTSGKTATLQGIGIAGAYNASLRTYFIKDRSGTFTGGETLTNGTYTATYSEISNNVGYMMTGQGGSLVMRYNSINLALNKDNQMMDIHGLQSMTGATSDRTCNEYSAVKAEIYGNIWTNNSVAVAYWVVHRGSWLLMFNNPISGTHPTVPRPRAHEYSCDTCQSNSSAIRWSQHIQNTYSFNNQYNGTEAPYYIDIDDCATAGGYEITENIDFWNYNANALNGTTQKGINCGSAAPTASASEGDGYWQTTASPCSAPPTTLSNMKTYTQAGRFWKYTGGTWTAYYTPYTYPHPLRNEPFQPNSGKRTGGGASGGVMK